MRVYALWALVCVLCVFIVCCTMQGLQYMHEISTAEAEYMTMLKDILEKSNSTYIIVI